MKELADKNFYPDANSSMRLTYGTVGDYIPRDAVKYNYFTTLKGYIEKEIPGDDEFDVPAKLKELYYAKDYGRYADADRQWLHRSCPGEMVPDRLDQGVGFVNQPVDAGFSGDGDEKFISAHPHAYVARAKLLQQLAGFFKDLVAKVMAESIVDQFEIVQVDVQQANTIRYRGGIDIFVKIAAGI